MSVFVQMQRIVENNNLKYMRMLNLSTLFDNVYFMVEKLVHYNLTCF